MTKLAAISTYIRVRVMCVSVLYAGKYHGNSIINIMKHAPWPMEP